VKTIHFDVEVKGYQQLSVVVADNAVGEAVEEAMSNEADRWINKASILDLRNKSYSCQELGRDWE